MCFVVSCPHRLSSLKLNSIRRIIVNTTSLHSDLPSYRCCAVCWLLVFEDVMGSAQHYHISKVVAQSKEPEEITRKGAQTWWADLDVSISDNWGTEDNISRSSSLTHPGYVSDLVYLSVISPATILDNHHQISNHPNLARTQPICS